MLSPAVANEIQKNGNMEPFNRDFRKTAVSNGHHIKVTSVRSNTLHTLRSGLRHSVSQQLFNYLLTNYNTIKNYVLIVYQLINFGHVATCRPGLQRLRPLDHQETHTTVMLRVSIL